MKTMGARLVGVFTACLLGVGLSAPPSAQAQSGATAQRADSPRVTARAGAHNLTLIAPTANGRFVVGVKKDRLVRYRTKPTKIRETGRSRPTDRLRYRERSIAVHPNGRFAYVAVQHKRRAKKYAVLVFRIDRPTPKLVKTISLEGVYSTKRINLWAMAMRPDGKRLYVNVGKDLVTFLMGHGRRGKLLSVQKSRSVDTPMAVTPDGSKLITGVSGGESPDHANYRTWDISGADAPVPGPVQQMDLSGYDLDSDAFLSEIVPAPDSATAYVQVDSWDEDYADVLVARVTLVDGAITATLSDPHGPYTFEALLGRSPSGKRIYGLNRGPGGSSEDDRDPFLARANSELANYQRLKPGRFAVGSTFAVSMAGKTKGLIYSLQWRDGKRFLVSIRN